jgi:hypothetical protein
MLMMLASEAGETFAMETVSRWQSPQSAVHTEETKPFSPEPATESRRKSEKQIKITSRIN